MIIEVALGVVLGFVLIAYWRVFLGLAIMALIAIVCLALLWLAGWLIYLAYGEFTAFKADHAGFFSAAGAVFALAFGVLVNVAIGAACGKPLQERTRLSPRQGALFGIVFWVLFLTTVITIGQRSALMAKFPAFPPWLFVAAFVSAWAAAIYQCVVVNRRNTLAGAPSTEHLSSESTHP